MQLLMDSIGSRFVHLTPFACRLVFREHKYSLRSSIVFWWNLAFKDWCRILNIINIAAADDLAIQGHQRPGYCHSYAGIKRSQQHRGEINRYGVYVAFLCRIISRSLGSTSYDFDKHYTKWSGYKRVVTFLKVSECQYTVPYFRSPIPNTYFPGS